METTMVAMLWTHAETAAWLRVDPLLLTHLVAAGTGPVCYWVGRHRRYDPAEVRAWLNGTRTPRRCRGRHAAPSPFTTTWPLPTGSAA